MEHTPIVHRPARRGALVAFASAVLLLAACGGASRAPYASGSYRAQGYTTESSPTVASTAPADMAPSYASGGASAGGGGGGAAMPSRPAVAPAAFSGVSAGADSARSSHGTTRTATTTPGGASSTALNNTPPSGNANDNAGHTPVSQMLIYTAGITLMVDQVAPAIDRAIETAVASGGFLAQRTDTTVQVRIPSARFREVLAAFERLGDVQHREVQAEDVSEQFHDMEVQLANLRAVQRRLQEFLTRANNINEMLNVERELERISGQIDQIEGRMRFLQSRAAFSTITLTMMPRPVVVQNGPQTPPTVPVWLPNPQLSSSVDWLRDLGLQRLLQLRF